MTTQLSITLKTITHSSFGYTNYFSNEQFQQFKQNICLSTQMNSLFSSSNNWKRSCVFVNDYLLDIHILDICVSYLQYAKVPLLICCSSNNLDDLLEKMKLNSYLSSIIDVIYCN